MPNNNTSSPNYTFKSCSIQGCKRLGIKVREHRFYPKGFCQYHYLKMRSSGDSKIGELRQNHGKSYSKEYNSWHAMLQRCTNKNNTQYHLYGGRGIKVCDEWYKFINFYKDMGEKPTANHSLDRIDFNGDYEPANCRWADRFTQSINKRVQSRNKLGVKGVYLDQHTNKYMAYIGLEGSNKVIGRYDSLEEAISARLMAESIYW